MTQSQAKTEAAAIAEAMQGALPPAEAEPVSRLAAGRTAVTGEVDAQSSPAPLPRIRVIDLESSGDTPDRDEHGICEIGFTDVVATGVDLLGAPAMWEVVEGKSRLCNPGVPIPPETASVHNIIDADVAAEPNWKPLLRAVIRSLRTDGVIAIGGHGVDFEMKWIHPEWWGEIGPLPFIDSYKTSLRVWKEAPLHSNAGLRYWRMPAGLDRNKALPHHRAGPDSYVTAFHIRDLLNEGTPLQQMIEWTKIPALTVRCKMTPRYRNGGKGTPWEEVDDGLLHWILGRPDMDEDTVYTARHHLELRAQAASEAAERAALDDQLRANGLPVGLIEVENMGEQGISTIPGAPSADPNQGALEL